MYTLAIDLGGTRIKAGLLDGKKLVDSCSEKASSEKGLQNSLPLIEKMVDCLLENQNISEKELLGIGFSFAGLVDSVHNRVISTNKKYDDAPQLDLPCWAKERWNLPLISKMMHGWHCSVNGDMSEDRKYRDDNLGHRYRIGSPHRRETTQGQTFSGR